MFKEPRGSQEKENRETKHRENTKKKTSSISIITLNINDSKILLKREWGVPCGPVVKNLPANAGDMGSIPGLGRSHMLRSN